MSAPDAAGERARLRLKAGRERPLRDGHPWVFSGAVAEEAGPPDAALAEVVDARGQSVGFGFYSPGSRIRVRLLPDRPRSVDAAYFGERIDEALALRRRVLGPLTDGYRILNAEGDGVPAWTVDRFGPVLVSQITSAGLERLRDVAYDALAERFPESPSSIGAPSPRGAARTSP